MVLNHFSVTKIEISQPKNEKIEDHKVAESSFDKRLMNSAAMKD